MALVELITVLALLQFLFFGILVSRARERSGIKAPAMTGNELFERYVRVQANTLELLILFLPALWLAVAHVAALWLALLGALYLVGRFIYLRAYVAEPSKRSLGFGLSAAPILALLVIDLIGALSRLIKH
jgi:uncharacterized membrane protein YecN with MAPEG domain